MWVLYVSRAVHAAIAEMRQTTAVNTATGTQAFGPSP